MARWTGIVVFDGQAARAQQQRVAPALQAVNLLLQPEAGHVGHILHTLDEALAAAPVPEVTRPDTPPTRELPS